MIVVLDIISTIAFAISGAIVAINKKMDLFGIAILGLTTAIGGGVIRDIILGINPPTSFQNPRNAFIALITSLAIFLFFYVKQMKKKEKIKSNLLLIMDSIGLSIFTVMGVVTVMNAGHTNNLFLQVFLGVITGCGGGVLRDVMALEMPHIFVRHFYASASLIGALMCSILWSLIGQIPAIIVSAFIVFILRMCAAYYKWDLPRVN